MKIPEASTSAFNALVKQGIFMLSQKVEGRLKAYAGSLIPPAILNPFQEQAFHEIQHAFDEGFTTLLHGVTSSGKTEIYIHLIEQQLKKGKQVLYLLPEIALTTQLINRLQRHFGPAMLVYHSRFNEQERVEVWNALLANSRSGQVTGKLVVGARSALFLPFSRLGLVIVDEEHDPSYKQVDPAPRYNARDAAVVLAQRQDARVLLGSATPAMETYFNALSGKYSLVTLDRRHAEVAMPSVEVIDMKEARKRKQVSGHFSSALIDQLLLVLQEQKQAIVFQNRRGFAPSLECNVCAWTPRCVNCDVSLTYHKRDHELRCHYCGYTLHIPSNCAACGDQDLRMRGFGTERIEEDLQLIFPEAKIARLDYDTTRGKEAFSRIISAFESGEVDFLVGTQMVTKGLDFDRVSLVGILNADSLFHFPEFRANERGFQLLAQVSGRAGRRDHGKVVIQAYAKDHPVIHYVLKHDFRGFYMHELDERHKFNYPPYCRLIEIRLKHKDERKLERMSIELSRILRTRFGNRVLGPTVPYVNRVRNYYLRNLMLKIEKGLAVAEVKRLLMTSLEEYRAIPENRQLFIQVDVDPQ
jgi:primosomal protein N' (replication factor Y)